MVPVLTSDNTTRVVFIAMTAIVLGVAPVGTLGPAASAQDSPASAPPVIADPAECRIEPRPREDFIALTEATPGVLPSEMQGVAVATPIMPSGGIPAAPSVVAAVTETVEQLAACLNAGDLPRITALYTNDAFFHTFGGGTVSDPAMFEQQLASLSTPQPLPPEQQFAVPVVRDVRLLPDGRVTALVGTGSGESLTVFAKVGERYLIDWIYRPSDTGTPEP